jgi:hypothetical protein
MAILRAGVMGTSSATPGGYAMGAATDNVHLRCPRGAIARLAGHASSWTTEAVYPPRTTAGADHRSRGRGHDLQAETTK